MGSLFHAAGPAAGGGGEAVQGRRIRLKIGAKAVRHARAPASVVDDGNPDPNAMVTQHVEVRLRGGGSLTLEPQQVLGSPEAPLNWEQNRVKFRRNWGYGAHPCDPEAGERLIEMEEGLEAPANMRELAALLRP